MQINRLNRILCALLAAVMLAGCLPRAAGQAPITLTVFAAASLTDVFTELGRQFEAAQPGVRVVFNFAGSQQLRGQLEQGAFADVFASANTQEMDAAIAAGLVAADAPQALAHNHLVVIYPHDNPAHLATLADLAQPGLKLDMADPAVPAGGYTLELLDRLSAEPAYGPDFKMRVLANVVSRENDVRAVVSKVRLGEVDAGIVYASDAAAGGNRPGTAATPMPGLLDVPAQFSPLVVYPIAPLAQAQQPELAQAFIALALSPAGRQVLDRAGFTVD